MSLTSIGWSNLAQSLSSLNVSQINGISTPPTADASQQVSSADSIASDNGASVSISSGGQMMSKLQQLQSQDPAKFKQLMTDVSNQLQAAASSSSGTDQKFLSNMANKFAQAANGDLSALQPQQQQSANNAISAYTQSAQNGSMLSQPSPLIHPMVTIMEEVEVKAAHPSSKPFQVYSMN